MVDVQKQETNIAVDKRAGKYLSFALGDEEYGVTVLSVQEIIGVMTVTRVPQTPDFVKGVINLRGKVIPVVDLRIKFGMPEKESDSETCIVVVEVGAIRMGILIDTVHEVVDINDEQIEDAPSFGASVDTLFIRGMAKIKERVIILLDIESVLGNDLKSVIDAVEE